MEYSCLAQNGICRFPKHNSGVNTEENDKYKEYPKKITLPVDMEKGKSWINFEKG